MKKFVNVIPLHDYKLQVYTNDGKVFLFDVKKEIQHIQSYEALQNDIFFKRVKFNQHRIYWDNDHDFHIDQVLDLATEIKQNDKQGTIS